MGIQLLGSGGNAVNSDANTGAIYNNPRPINVGALGSYSAGSGSGIMAAGLGAAAPIFTFRGPATGLCLIKRVKLSAIGLGTAFAAGSALFNLIACRAFTVNDTGGGALTLTTNNAKRRTTFGVTGVQDIRCSATATLTAGTRTKDAAPLATLFGVCSASASVVMVPPTNILDYVPGEWPLVLAANEGFTIEATVAATGTWSFSATVDWDEVAAATI